ncbi:MAG: DUF427 domain-containing protein [Jatrophihabitans sp.]|uniref:DUF427 domain-containing protein n=1 Tax=Jatrophihabitans sp. TaxID=1932789 RepID=UPI003F7EB204
MSQDSTPAEPWRDFPPMAATTGRVEPAPRRVRGLLAGHTVVDTVAARYVWEHERYPQYYLPVADIDASVLVDEGRTQHLRFGTARRHGLRVGDTVREGVVRLFGDDAVPGLAGTARIEWSALDAWFEEDEQVYVHPRNPYTRVDAVRSSRHVRVELDGVVLAESRSPVLVFETGLPTRYYLDPTDVDLSLLRANQTRTECPYKGRTTGYWDAVAGDTVVPDAAWSYAFTTAALQPIAGLVAFLNEGVDLTVDGTRLVRPVSPFS